MSQTQQTVPIEGKITLPPESREVLKKAMKIAYYKEFLRQGIISIAEFDRLMLMQSKSAN